MGVHENTGVYTAIQGFTGEYRGLHEYTWVNMRIQGFTGVYVAIYGMYYNPGDYMVGDYM